MGCCPCISQRLGEILRVEIDDLNKLEAEIVSILDNKDNVDQTNNNSLIELINKISVIIARREEIEEQINLKQKRFKNLFEREKLFFPDSKINELKQYNTFLNNLINDNKKKNQKDIKKVLIYYKKNIKRSSFQSYKNIKNKLIDSTNVNTTDNIVLQVDNGNKIMIENKKGDNFLNIISQLGERDENYKDIENIQLMYKNMDITDKIKTGEFNPFAELKDDRIIQVKLKHQ